MPRNYTREGQDDPDNYRPFGTFRTIALTRQGCAWADEYAALTRILQRDPTDDELAQVNTIILGYHGQPPEYQGRRRN